MIEPQEVSEAQMAYPAKVIGTFLPAIDEIPKKYKNPNGNEWYDKLVSHWFFKGLSSGTKFYPKEGVNPEMAYRHIQCILGSFEPGHEHKVAGCCYLLDLWFEKVEDYDNF